MMSNSEELLVDVDLLPRESLSNDAENSMQQSKSPGGAKEAPTTPIGFESLGIVEESAHCVEPKSKQNEPSESDSVKQWRAAQAEQLKTKGTLSFRKVVVSQRVAFYRCRCGRGAEDRTVDGRGC